MRFHIDNFSDASTYRIEIKGKLIKFTWSDMFGPLPETDSGKIIDDLPKKYEAAFYEKTTLWFQQGKRIVDGLCIWDEPKQFPDDAPDGFYWHQINSRNYLLRRIEEPAQ